MKSQNRIKRRRGLIVTVVLLSLLLIALVIFAVSKEMERTARLANPTETTAETTLSAAATETTMATEPTAATELTEEETEPSATEEPPPTEETGAQQPDNSGGQQSEYSGSGGNNSGGNSSGGGSSVVSSVVVSGSSSAETEPQPEDELVVAQITCDRYSRFTGQYVEDGSDDLVYDVAAILVTNRSEKYLEIATLTYQIDGKNASFVVTGLPAGQSAWVMEANRITVTDDSAFTYVDVATSFRDDVTASTSKVSVSADGNMMTVTNNSGGTLEGVYVYYKVRHTDGNYLGGITYRVDIGTLEAGASATSLAGHYSEDAEIVRIGWQTE